MSNADGFFAVVTTTRTGPFILDVDARNRPRNRVYALGLRGAVVQEDE